MTIDEARAELSALRGLAERGEDMKAHKQRIRELYRAVLGKSLRECNCKDVLADALIEIYNKLKNNTLIMAKARLLNGVVLQVGGQHYTNANLTDEVARQFLEVFPQRKDWFDVLPSEPKEGTPEKGTETAPKAVKAEKGTTTPKKREKPEKGK